MIHRIILLFISLFLFTACVTQPNVIYDNKSITDPQEKKKRFEQDSLYCEVNAYKNVPEVPYQAPQSNHGSFEIKDQYGNKYDGTYRQGGSFSSGFASGAAYRQQVRLENLRQRMIQVCMNQRGWTVVAEGNETEESIQTINSVKQNKSIFKKNIEYKCASYGFSEDGKIYSDQKLNMDTLFYFKVNNNNIQIKDGISLYFYKQLDSAKVYYNDKSNLMFTLNEVNLKSKEISIVHKPPMVLLYQCVESDRELKFVP